MKLFQKPDRKELARQEFRSVLLSDFTLATFFVDTSPSMFSANGYPQLEAALSKAVATICGMPDLRDSLEASVLGFGKKVSIEEFTPFGHISKLKFPERPDAIDSFILEGYCTAVAKTALRREELCRKLDRDPATCWVLVLSDFCVRSADAVYMDAALEAREFATNNGINILNLMAGDDVKEDMATALSQPGREPVSLAEHDFEKFFAEWLPRSLRSVSQLGPGTVLPPFNGKRLRAD